MAEVDACTIELAGSDGKLELTVCHDGATRDEGFFWLPCRCSFVIGAFRGEFSCSLTDADLRDLAADFGKISSGTGEALRFVTLEEDITLTFHRRKTGAVTVSGLLNPRLCDYAALRFEFDADVATFDRANDETARFLRTL